MGNVIGIIIFGAIVGALARLVLPGKQDVSTIMTVVLGIAGALIGYFIAGAIGVSQTSGIDWIRDIISVAVAAALVTGYVSISGRKA